MTNIDRWKKWLSAGHTPKDLAALLAEDVVFYSPVVHTPQRGKMLTMGYLLAAGETLFNDSFRYTGTYDCRDRAVLEFETNIDGIIVNGVDMISWNAEGQIIEIKVMVRPLKGMQIVHENMGRELEELKAQHLD